MFGYIRVDKPELKIKDYEMYKAVYCTLCRKLGRKYGILSRLTLSYDFTFLALLNMSLKNSCDMIERKRCAFSPLKKCNYCKNDSELDMPSAAAMIMLYYKLKDDIYDEHGIKKLLKTLLLPIFSGARKKAAKQYPVIENIVSSFIEKQRILEKNACRSIDEAADPTAAALSEILALCSDNASQKRVLNRLGYCLGRYIYILDAACDLEKDIKNNSYNVLKYDIVGSPREYARERTVGQLYICANEAAKAFELLDIKKYKPILGNIIYLGLEDTFKKELNK